MEIIGECKSCGHIILDSSELSYGCPRCESKILGKYTGIIVEYINRGSQTD